MKDGKYKKQENFISIFNQTKKSFNYKKDSLHYKIL